MLINLKLLKPFQKGYFDWSQLVVKLEGKVLCLFYFYRMYERDFLWKSVKILEALACCMKSSVLL